MRAAPLRTAHSPRCAAPQNVQQQARHGRLPLSADLRLGAQRSSHRLASRRVSSRRYHSRAVRRTFAVVRWQEIDQVEHRHIVMDIFTQKLIGKAYIQACAPLPVCSCAPQTSLLGAMQMFRETLVEAFLAQTPTRQT